MRPITMQFLPCKLNNTLTIFAVHGKIILKWILKIGWLVGWLVGWFFR
jgi:hypothetical protein